MVLYDSLVPMVRIADCSVKNRTWCRVIVRQFSALGRRSAAVLVDRVQCILQTKASEKNRL